MYTQVETAMGTLTYPLLSTGLSFLDVFAISQDDERILVTNIFPSWMAYLISYEPTNVWHKIILLLTKKT